MIPLLHIITFLSALFCLLAAKRLYSSYRETKSVNVGDFLKAYIALGIYFTLVSLPAILSDPLKVQVVYILSYIPVILSATFLFRVALRILKYQLWAGYLSFFIYSLIIIITTLNIIFFSPASIRASNSTFYHWGEGTPAWLGSFNGLLIGILATGCTLLFFLGGRKSEEKLVRTRAFLIGSGLSLLIVAALFNYVAPAYFQGIIGWLVSALASLVALGGLILMLVGVYYKRREAPAD